MEWIDGYEASRAKQGGRARMMTGVPIAPPGGASFRTGNASKGPDLGADHRSNLGCCSRHQRVMSGGIRAGGRGEGWRGCCL